MAEKSAYLHAEDGDYFPCMIAAHIAVAAGDSGGAVLVRGIPAGVTSRSFAGNLGFTPLAEGLAQLGLELCTTPDCGLTPPIPAETTHVAESTTLDLATNATTYELIAGDTRRVWAVPDVRGSGADTRI